MKNLILSALMLFIGITLSHAQERQEKREMPSPEERSKRMVERLNKELKLTAAQKDSITKWTTEFSKQQQGFFKDENGTREEKMEKMKSLREQQTKKIKSVLTAEQSKKYDEMNKNMREGGRRPQGNP